MWEVFLDSSVPQDLAFLATMTGDSLYGLAMIHVHHNDTVGQVIPEAVLKRRDSSGNRKIHLAFTDLVLSFEIVH